MGKVLFEKAKNRVLAVAMAALLVLNTVLVVGGSVKVSANAVSGTDISAELVTKQTIAPEETVIEAVGQEAPTENGAEEQPADEQTADGEEAEIPAEETEGVEEPADTQECVSAAAQGASSGAEPVIPVSESDLVADIMPVPVIMSKSDMLLGASPAPDDIASGTMGTCSWIIDKDGNLTIFPTDGVSGSCSVNSCPWESYKTSVKTAYVEPGVSLTGGGSYMFKGNSNLATADLHNLDTTNATSFQSLFDGCNNLVTLDITGWKFSNVTNLSWMFNQCNKLNSLDVSDWDVSKVTDMSIMFQGCRSIPVLDVSKWNVSNVTNMSTLFSGCSGVSELDVSNWKVSNVTSMAVLFAGCSKPTSIDVSKWDTSACTNMESMFSGCSGLTKLDVSNFDTSSVTKMSGMFSGCSSLSTIDVSGFKTGNVTTMESMFQTCKSLIELDVSSFDTKNVTTMKGMFYYCEKLPKIDVSHFDTSKVNNMNDMFCDCRCVEVLDVSGFVVNNVVNMQQMFLECKQIKKLDVSKWNTSKNQSMWGTFRECTALEELDVSGWDTSNVNSMAYTFAGCEKLETLDVSGFNTGKVTNMTQMFSNCMSVKKIDVSGFNTSKATEMSSIFYSDTAITEYEVSAKWKPASNYSQLNSINSFNVVDGELKYAPYGKYKVKSVTVHDGGTDITVDLKANPSAWSGFTGDMTATIVFAVPLTVTFKDMTAIGGSYDITVEEQPVFKGEAAVDPYKNGTTNPKTGYVFSGWDKDFSNVTENITVNALYEVQKLNVTAEAGKGGKATPAEQKVEYNGGTQVTITPDDGYRIGSVTVNGTAFDRTALTLDSGSFVLALNNITADTTVKAEFTKFDDIQLRMGKNFKYTDDITFTAVGSWIDDTTLLEGDVKYVPDNWHHDFPKGDWGGIDAPTYSYTGKFNQPAGKYTIHVIFNKFIYRSGAWTADGTKELTNTYLVKGDLLGGNDDIPGTGDDFNPVLWIYIGSVCFIAMIVLGILYAKKKKEQ